MTAEAFITILSASGVILVTIYNIVSSKHYREAKQAEIDSKDATIQSKQSEIDTLVRFTSSHVLAEYDALKEMSEKRVARYEQEAAQKNKELLDARIQHLLTKGELTILENEHRQAQELLALSTEVHEQVSDLSGSLVFQAFAPTISTSPAPENDDK